jgi:hypothetical protein
MKLSGFYSIAFLELYSIDKTQKLIKCNGAKIINAKIFRIQKFFPFFCPITKPYINVRQPYVAEQFDASGEEFKRYYATE